MLQGAGCEKVGMVGKSGLMFMIYLVDDAADYRFLVQQVFKRFLPQYALQSFADGLDLMHFIEQQGKKGDKRTPESLPCLILLDGDMPKLSGPQTLQRLKQVPGWQDVPVVIISNRNDDGFVKACYERGVSSFIVKPLGLNELKTTMTLLCQYWIDKNQIPAVHNPDSP